MLAISRFGSATNSSRIFPSSDQSVQQLAKKNEEQKIEVFYQNQPTNEEQHSMNIDEEQNNHHNNEKILDEEQYQEQEQKQEQIIETNEKQEQPIELIVQQQHVESFGIEDNHIEESNQINITETRVESSSSSFSRISFTQLKNLLQPVKSLNIQIQNGNVYEKSLSQIRKSLTLGSRGPTIEGADQVTAIEQDINYANETIIEQDTIYENFKKEFLLCLKHYDLYPCTLEEMIIFDYVVKMATYFHPMCFRWSKKNLLTLNEYNQKGSTLLCLAVKLQRVECSILLLSNGADPNLFDKITLRSPLQFACYFGNYLLVTALIERGADFNHKDKFKVTPLMFACMSKDINLNVVKELVKLHADIYAKDDLGWTCLHYVVRSESENSVPIINYLLANGADRDMRDKKKLTAIHLAKYLGYDRCEAALVTFKETLSLN